VERGYGEDGITRGVLSGGGQEFGEADVVLKTSLLQNFPCHVIIFDHVRNIKCMSW